MTSTERPALTKRRMVQLIHYRTRLTHKQVTNVLEAFIELVSQEIATEGRVELENFLTLDVKTVKHRSPYGSAVIAYKAVRCRPGRRLRAMLRENPPGNHKRR
ncbi:MAG: HU family DNA-binding protein [Chloroflexota bacterium]